MYKKKVSVVITDLDNTLFDWFQIWHRSFSSMLNKIVEDSGIKRKKLIREIKKIHQNVGTAEYAFLIENIPSLQKRHKGEDLTEIYREAIEEFRSERRKYLKLYPKVMDTLRELKRKGCLIVAYTESRESIQIIE